MIVINILLTILAFLLFIIILIFVCPIKYSFDYKKFDTLSYSNTVSLLFGSFKVHISKESSGIKSNILSIFGLKMQMDKKKVKTKKVKKDSKKKQAPDISLFMKLLDSRFINELFHDIKKMLQHILPKTFKLTGKLGFEDPYHTGIFSAAYSTFGNFLNNYEISIKPVFEEEIYEGELLVKGNIYLVLILYLIIKILASIPNKLYLLKKSIFKKGDIKYV